MPEGIEWRGQERFFGRLDKLARAYPGATDKCAAGIGTEVLHDAINEVPTVPINTGKLRSSGTFEVFGGAHWRHAKIIVGFNTSYAAKVHQLPMRFREPSAGNYFLSSKLQRHKRDYVESWTRCVARRLGMA